MSSIQRSARAACLLPFVVALLCLLGAVCVQASGVGSERQHALLIAIPLPGHVNPLLAQGMELRRRGWSVTIASPSRMSKHIQAGISDSMGEPNSSAWAPLTYMNLGECAAIAQLTQVLERAADHESYMESAREMFDWALSLHNCMFASLKQQLPLLPRRPDVIVTDFATYAGFDIADVFRIPCVVNNADLLNMLSPDDAAPYDFVPGVMTATSIAAHNSTRGWYGLLTRVVYPPLRVLLRYVAAVTAGRLLNEQQELSGLAPTPLFARMSSRLILVNNVFGLEYARPLPPNVVLVGPMLDKGWRKEVEEARSEYRKELSEEDAQWLAMTTTTTTSASADAAAASSLPVIWVSMGTIAPLNERQVREMYAALERGTRLGHFRVLWKLDPSDRPFLPSSLPSSAQLRILSWVSSQLGVLAHPATQIFISHCGINSVHESVYLEKKLLCIPILADQADMAARVHDAGVGVHLSKMTFTADELYDSLLSLLSPANTTLYASHLRRARASMLLSGGVERAVNYIEYASLHGVSALVPVDVAHPWHVRHHIDVYLIWALFGALTATFWHCLCCRIRPGKQCVQARDKKKKQKEEERQQRTRSKRE